MTDLTFAGINWRVELWTDESRPDPPVTDYAAIDTETEPIQPGKIPPLSILQAAFPNRVIQIVPYHLVPLYLKRLRALQPERELIFHNFAFDFFVLGGKSNRYLMNCIVNDPCRIADTGLRFTLKVLNDGGFDDKWSLDHVASKLLKGIKIDKDPKLRLSFRQGKPLTEEQLHYAAIDPAATLLLREVMPNAYPTEDIQIKGSVVLAEIGRNGMKVDRPYFEKKRLELLTKADNYLTRLDMAGWRPKEKGNRDVIQNWLKVEEDRVQRVYPDFKFPFTKAEREKMLLVESGEMDEEELSDDPLMELSEVVIESVPEELRSPVLTDFIEYKHVEKVLSTFLNPAFIAQDGRIHPSFENMKKTGRCSCRRPNVSFSNSCNCVF